jgi:hypothetical protein
MNVEPFIFTGRSKKELIEGLVVSCDSRAITIPPTARFEVFRHELESFEYVLDGGEVKYGAPANMHDDCVMSLALATRGVRVGVSHQGFLDYMPQHRMQMLTADVGADEAKRIIEDEDALAAAVERGEEDRRQRELEQEQRDRLEADARERENPSIKFR